MPTDPLCDYRNLQKWLSKASNLTARKTLVIHRKYFKKWIITIKKVGWRCRTLPCWNIWNRANATDGIDRLYTLGGDQNNSFYLKSLGIADVIKKAIANSTFKIISKFSNRLVPTKQKTVSITQAKETNRNLLLCVMASVIQESIDENVPTYLFIKVNSPSILGSNFVCSSLLDKLLDLDLQRIGEKER